jgi:DHA1 family bicyclomycin/chloramphenicol resistance-like MFS transporter
LEKRGKVTAMDHKKNHFQLRLALLLGVFSALGPFTIDMYLPSLPAITEDFNTRASLVQLSLTACLLGLGIGQLVMGALSDVHGRRKPLIISMLFYILASVTCAFAPNIGVFIVLRFIQGLAAAAGLVISRAIVRDLYSGHELTKFFSVLMLVSNLGPLVAPVAGSGVIAFTTWHGVFIALGMIGILLFLITVWKLNETLPIGKRVPGNLTQMIRNFSFLLRDRQFAGYALAQGIMIAGVFAYVSGTPFIYQNIYGASPQLFAILFRSNGIGLILGSQVVGRLAHRVSERHFLLMGLLLSCASSLAVLTVVLLEGPLFSLVIPLFFFVASIGMTATASFSLAMEHQGHIAGSASALLGLLPFLLGAVTSPLVGIAGEHTAVPLGIIILSTSLLALIAYFALAKKSEKELV